MPILARSRWVRLNRSVAAEQAEWRIGAGPPASATRSPIRWNAAICSSANAWSVVSSMFAKWVESPPGGRPARPRRLGPGQLVGLEPLPVGPGLDLEVDARRPALPVGGARQRGDGRRIVEGEAQVGGDGLVEVLRRRVAETEDGDVRAHQAPQRDPLVRAPHREPGRAGAQGRGRHQRHAVAIGLALHHRGELRPAQPSREGADVGGDRAEVDSSQLTVPGGSPEGREGGRGSLSGIRGV